MDEDVKDYIDAKFAELSGLIKQVLAPSGDAGSPDMTTSAAMTFMSYTDRDAFLAAVKRDRIPFIRANKRRFLFPRAALVAWKEKRLRNPVSTL